MTGHSNLHEPEHVPEPAASEPGTHSINDADRAVGAELWVERLRELVIALYVQGRSARDVSTLVETVSFREVTRIVREAGITRGPSEAASFAAERKTARDAIARADLTRLAARWIRGAEVEDLAAERFWPPDLLWDALADTLSTPPATTDTTTDTATGPAGPASGSASAAEGVKCAGVCMFQCAQRCALTTGNASHVRLLGESVTSNGASNPRRRREGIPSVRTGLKLPAPGPHPRW